MDRSANVLAPSVVLFRPKNDASVAEPTRKRVKREPAASDVVKSETQDAATAPDEHVKEDIDDDDLTLAELSVASSVPSDADSEDNAIGEEHEQNKESSGEEEKVAKKEKPKKATIRLHSKLGPQ